MKKVFILEEFLNRSNSLITKRTKSHMRHLKKTTNIDMKMYTLCLQKQEWEIKIDESKKELQHAIKEVEEFTKNFNDMNNEQLENSLKKHIQTETYAQDT